MKILNSLVVILSICTLCGCASSPKFNYPKDIEGECFNARNQAKTKIESVGVSLQTKSGLTLNKHLGEKKFGRMWCWFDDKYWQMYVGGLCYGSLIEIGCNPKTGGETMFDVNEHEHAHYWLISNYNSYTHDPRFSKLFYNWFEPKIIDTRDMDTKAAREMVKSIYDSMPEGSWLSATGKDENGVEYQIDFIVIKDELTRSKIRE